MALVSLGISHTKLYVEPPELRGMSCQGEIAFPPSEKYMRQSMDSMSPCIGTSTHWHTGSQIHTNTHYTEADAIVLMCAEADGRAYLGLSDVRLGSNSRCPASDRCRASRNAAACLHKHALISGDILDCREKVKIRASVTVCSRADVRGAGTVQRLMKHQQGRSGLRCT